MKSSVDGSLSSVNNDGASTSRTITDEDVEAVVEKFCQHLTKLEFDSAQHCIESHKLVTISWAHSSDKIWQQILVIIAQLATAEQGYYALSFFTPKFSITKNHHMPKDQYSKIRQDLRRIDDNASSPFSHPEIVNNQIRKSIVEHFCNYAAARIDLIEFYSGLQSKDWRSVVDESLARLDAMEVVYNMTIPSPLSPQPDLIVRELRFLKTAFNLKKLLFKCQMLDSLLMMKELRQLLTEFLKEVRPGAVTKHSNSGLFSFIKPSKTPQRLFLLNWFIALYNTVLFKFSLYFNDVLGSYLPANDLKLFQSTNTNMNMYNHFSTYMRKQGCSVIAVVMCRGSDQAPFYGFGYHRFLQKFPLDTVPIRDRFPVLMSMINDKNRNYESFKQKIDNFLFIFHQRAQEEDKPKYFAEKIRDIDTSYFCAHIEWQLFLVLSFDKKVVEKDNSVLTFLGDVIGFLRCTRLYQELRTPSKSRE